MYVIQCNGDPYDDSSDLPSDILVRGAHGHSAGIQVIGYIENSKKNSAGHSAPQNLFGENTGDTNNYM